MIYNNLCAYCNQEREAGVDISDRLTRIKIYTDCTQGTDVIECCIHGDNEPFPNQGSIIDLGVCTCYRPRRGFLVPPEEQIGILTLRDDDIQTLGVELSPNLLTHCTSCAPQTCPHCNKHTRGTIKIKVDNDKTLIVCNSCINTFHKCICCKDIYIANEYDESLCKHCQITMRICLNCDSFRHKDSFKSYGDINICDICTTLDRCSFCNKDVYVLQTSSLKICSKCRCTFKRISNMKGYGRTRVHTMLRAKGENKGNTSSPKLYFGLENEIQLNISKAKRFNGRFTPDRLQENQNVVSTIAVNIFDTIECKRDGSLHRAFGGTQYSNGVELVWQPMSWQYIKENENKFKELFNELAPFLHKDFNNAGLHIHLNKDAFTSFHFLKFSVFFYSLEKEELIQKIARRSFNGYAARQLVYVHDKKVFSTTRYAKRIAIKEGRLKQGKDLLYPSSRYDIINTTGSETYEVRIFKGARTYEEFMLSIEFVHAIFYYTKNMAAPSVSVEGFCEYVKADKQIYPILHKEVN